MARLSSTQPAGPRSKARERILAALSGILAGTDWQSVGIHEIASRSGVSRQTVYNVFGTRSGLATAFVTTLLERLIVPQLEGEPLRSSSEAEDALAAGFEAFFTALAQDPVLRPWRESAGTRLPFRGLVTDEARLVDDASQRLAAAYQRRLPGVSDEEAATLARAVTRVCVSYLASPPAEHEEPSRDLARVFAPYAESVIDRMRSTEPSQ